jgi:predicted RNA binding protein YcfA (HicA-like mRNA interferase family)
LPQIAPVPYQTLVRVFESDGFVFVRQRGDHLIYTRAGLKRPLVIPAKPTLEQGANVASVRTAVVPEAVIADGVVRLPVQHHGDSAELTHVLVHGADERKVRQ